MILLYKVEHKLDSKDIDPLIINDVEHSFYTRNLKAAIKKVKKKYYKEFVRYIYARIICDSHVSLFDNEIKKICTYTDNYHLQLELVGDEDLNIRAMLSLNRELCKEAQLTLVKDKDYRIREVLAVNPSICEDVQLILSKSKSSLVQELLLENHSVLKDIKDLIRKNISNSKQNNSNLSSENDSNIYSATWDTESLKLPRDREL